MPITINGSGTITGASTLATTVASPTFTTPNLNSAQFPTVLGTAPLYACRAWVNFNGGVSFVIRASVNVTSITDNGVGDYTINFTTAMPDVNYSYGGAAGVTGGSGRFVSVDDSAATTMLTTSVRISVNSGVNTKVDADRVLVQVIR
jgi:hypothetical protein